MTAINSGKMIRGERFAQFHEVDYYVHCLELGDINGKWEIE